MSATKTTLTTAAALAAGIGIGIISKPAPDTALKYAEKIEKTTATDEIVAIHKEPVYADSLIIKDKDTTAVHYVVDSVTVPEYVKREWAPYRTPAGKKLVKGDTLRVLVSVNDTVVGVIDRPITESATVEGQVLKAYIKTVIWSDTDSLALAKPKVIGEMIP